MLFEMAHEQSHYAAPFAPLLFVLGAAAATRAARFGRGGIRPARLAAAALPLLAAWHLAGRVLELPFIGYPAGMAAAQQAVLHDRAFFLDSPNPASPSHLRARIEQELRAEGGKHLVIVASDPQHSMEDEWVYNGADIDGSPVVWARDLGDAENPALLAYFHDRQVHRVKLD